MIKRKNYQKQQLVGEAQSRQQEFSSGHPPKYFPVSKLLNFIDQTVTVVFNLSSTLDIHEQSRKTCWPPTTINRLFSTATQHPQTFAEICRRILKYKLAYLTKKERKKSVAAAAADAAAAIASKTFPFSPEYLWVEATKEKFSAPKKNRPAQIFFCFFKTNHL